MSRHKDKPSWDNCCSCVPILERQIKELESVIKDIVEVKDKHNKPHPMDRPNRKGSVKGLLDSDSTWRK